MASGVFKTVQIQDNPDLNRIQGNVSDAFNSLTGSFIGGVLMSGVTVGSSPTVINHKLGRTPGIWVLCDQNTNTNVWRTDWSSTSITLEAGASCTVSLWLN